MAKKQTRPFKPGQVVKINKTVFGWEDQLSSELITIAKKENKFTVNEVFRGYVTIVESANGSWRVYNKFFMPIKKPLIIISE